MTRLCAALGCRCRLSVADRGDLCPMCQVWADEHPNEPVRACARCERNPRMPGLSYCRACRSAQVLAAHHKKNPMVKARKRAQRRREREQTQAGS